MRKPDYIKELEKNNGIFSETRLSYTLNDITKLDSNKNLVTVYVENVVSEENEVYTAAKLYKTTGGFYIYWEKVLSQYFISVYHKPEKSKEILIFLLSLNKK